MTSVALNRWTTIAKASLDEIASAHAAVRGSGSGRRRATVQVNHAYALLVSSLDTETLGSPHTVHDDWAYMLKCSISCASAVSGCQQVYGATVTYDYAPLP